MPPETVKKVYDLWVDNSITSTVGNNGRNMVNITRGLLEVYGCEINHEDIKSETRISKRNQTLLSVNRRVATCTVRAIKNKLESENCKVSVGTVLNLKPFFITYPTDKELALCLCKICLNTRLLLEPLVVQGNKDGNLVTESVTGFFMDTIPCVKNENRFYKWTCVTQKCKHCKNIKPINLECSNSSECTKVSQFEVTETPYEHRQ